MDARDSRELGTGDLEEFRSAGHALVDAIADHLAALPGQAVWQPVPDDLRAQILSLPLPDGPTAMGSLAEVMARDVLPYPMGNGHPAFFGWVNPPPSLSGVLASLTAAAMNPSVVSGDHADVHVERTVVRWLGELVGYPHTPGGGLLTSGASAATIVCVAGARSRAAAAAGYDVRRDGLRGGPRLLCYVPSEAHSCVARAIELLGLGRESIRPVPIHDGRLDQRALQSAIAADRAAGGTPALLVGSAGTVNTGAIDPLEALAEVAAAEGLWFHVDGAYGAFGVLDPAIAARTAAWRARTRSCSTHTNGSAFRSTRAARSSNTPMIYGRHSASSRRISARTPGRRWAPSPSTARSRRGRFAR